MVWDGEGREKNCVPLTAPRGTRPPPAPRTGEGRGGVATSAVGPVTCHKAGPISFAPPPPHPHIFAGKDAEWSERWADGVLWLYRWIDHVRVQTRPPLRPPLPPRLHSTASPSIPSAVIGDVATKRELGCRPISLQDGYLGFSKFLDFDPQNFKKQVFLEKVL